MANETADKVIDPDGGYRLLAAAILRRALNELEYSKGLSRLDAYLWLDFHGRSLACDVFDIPERAFQDTFIKHIRKGLSKSKRSQQNVG